MNGSNTHPILYRDDDPNVYTDAYLFKKLHEKFIEEGKVHTVAVLMKDLWQNHALFYYLATVSNLSVELHGWTHKDYAALSYDECYNDLKESIDYWNTNAKRMLGLQELPFDKQITTFFSPWNHDGENIRRASANLGLRFCNVDNGEWEGKTIKSFHWWDVMRVPMDFKLSDICG